MHHKFYKSRRIKKFIFFSGFFNAFVSQLELQKTKNGLTFQFYITKKKAKIMTSYTLFNVIHTAWRHTLCWNFLTLFWITHPIRYSWVHYPKEIHSRCTDFTSIKEVHTHLKLYIVNFGIPDEFLLVFNM